ncbi:MAG: hypothetical protein JO223_04740 [Hyphomicrobiales bacterium]|nr:hypothetical protein [Hyphomicrobiales bacterium]MBV8414626.1 hypothetical protein [Verrucomicrobiota bacterium]
MTWTYVNDGTTHTEATWRQDSAPTPHFFLPGDVTSVPVSDFVAPTLPPRSFVAYYDPDGPESGVMFSTSFSGGVLLLGSTQI